MPYWKQNWCQCKYIHTFTGILGNMPIQCKYLYMLKIVHSVYKRYSVDIVHKINVYNLCTIWELAVIDVIEDLVFCKQIICRFMDPMAGSINYLPGFLRCWLTKAVSGELPTPISWEFFVQLKICSAKRPGHRLRRRGAWSSHFVWSASPQKTQQKTMDSTGWRTTFIWILHDICWIQCVYK